ncbi:MAG TPA: dTDP-4-dehydrorhamnose reductase [Rudaea sp.]|jgi:dTDP-4-dehydrorhamnose reductase|nr:dTDP-4-dehydrorhamnose reductase [Rudaea sp.]
MKILLLGANGQVGFELKRSLAPLGDVVAATRNGEGGTLVADVGEATSLRSALEQSHADVIVNAAAYTAVDRGEDEPEVAQRINADALGEIGAWAKSRGVLVVHYSTDYVFDGNGMRPYREEDATSPLGVYGRSKLAGENALHVSECDHVILRTAWVYASRGKNFLLTMLKVGVERDRLRVVDDQRGTPTSAQLIADVTAKVVAKVHRDRANVGTYHLCAAGECTWFAFAQAIFTRAHEAGLIARAPLVEAIGTADYPTRAARPRYSVLDTSKLRAAFGVDLPPWQQGLDNVIAELAQSK